MSEEIKNGIKGAIFGLVLGIVSFFLIWDGLIEPILLVSPSFPEEWYIFAVPILVPTVVGFISAMEMLGICVKDTLLYLGKMVLVTIASNIVNFIGVIIISLIIALTTATFIDFLIAAIVVGAIGVPSAMVLVVFMGE